MKSISEILGGTQILLGLAYDIQDSFEEYLSTDYRAFLTMLRVVEGHLPPLVRNGSGMGRPTYDNLPFFRAFLAQSFFRITTTGALRNRLLTDPNLRQICGFSEVPSSATFSRRSSLHRCFSNRPLTPSGDLSRRIAFHGNMHKEAPRSLGAGKFSIFDSVRQKNESTVQHAGIMASSL